MNRDEAERARDLAKAALAESKFDKALRLSKRAFSLHAGIEVSIFPSFARVPARDRSCRCLSQGAAAIETVSRVLRDAKVLISGNPDWYTILSVSEPHCPAPRYICSS